MMSILLAAVLSVLRPLANLYEALGENVRLPVLSCVMISVRFDPDVMLVGNANVKLPVAVIVCTGPLLKSGVTVPEPELPMLYTDSL